MNKLSSIIRVCRRSIFITLSTFIIATKGVFAEQTTEGKERYFDFQCAACHGYVGQGNIGGQIGGPSLAPKTLPISAFMAIVRKPYGRMPAYPANLLSDADLELIHQYLSGLPMPPKVSEIPAFNQ